MRTGTRSVPVVAWAFGWLVVAGLVVVPHLFAYTHLSPFDELVHVDYMDKAGRLELVNGGEKVGETAMREQACRGHDIAGVLLPPCDAPKLTPEQFPDVGYNTAYPDPPVYYTLTAWVAELVDQLPDVDSIVTAGRSVGVLWLGGGLALTFLLGIRLGASRLASAGATLVVASSPTVVHATATITSDAPALLTGALLCLTALGVMAGRTSWWWLLPVAGLCTAIKATSLSVLGLVVVFLLVHLVWVRRKGKDSSGSEDEPADEPPSPRTIYLAIGAVVVGALVPLVGWTVVTSLTSGPGVEDIPMRETFAVSRLGWNNFGDNLFILTSPLQNGYVPPVMDAGAFFPFLVGVNLLLVCGVAALSWFGSLQHAPTRFAISTMAAMVLSGPAFVLLIFLGSHSYVPIPSRYGLSVVPAAAACVAVVLSRRRAGEVAALAIGVAGLAVLLTQTL